MKTSNTIFMRAAGLSVDSLHSRNLPSEDSSLPHPGGDSELGTQATCWWSESHWLGLVPPLPPGSPLSPRDPGLAAALRLPDAAPQGDVPASPRGSAVSQVTGS